MKTNKDYNNLNKKLYSDNTTLSRNNKPIKYTPDDLLLGWDKTITVDEKL